MIVRMQQVGKAALIRVEGDVDLYSSPKLRETVLDASRKGLSPIVINLSKVNYMDSSGVATLVEGLQLTKEYSGAIRIVGLNERVSEIFKLTRLHQVFEIWPTEAEALKAQPEP